MPQSVKTPPPPPRPSLAWLHCPPPLCVVDPFAPLVPSHLSLEALLLGPAHKALLVVGDVQATIQGTLQQKTRKKTSTLVSTCLTYVAGSVEGNRVDSNACCLQNAAACV
jgi:hypothetical protein